MHFWLRLQGWKKNNPWPESPLKAQTTLEVTENDYDDEWVRRGVILCYCVMLLFPCFLNFKDYHFEGSGLHFF